MRVSEDTSKDYTRGEYEYCTCHIDHGSGSHLTDGSSLLSLTSRKSDMLEVGMIVAPYKINDDRFRHAKVLAREWFF